MSGNVNIFSWILCCSLVTRSDPEVICAAASQKQNYFSLFVCSFITELYHKQVSYKHVKSHACSQPSSFKSPHTTLLYLLQVILKTKLRKCWF